MKYFYTLLALLCVLPCFAQEESRLYIGAGRETFFHFPSQTLGDKYTLRVYLPEDAGVKAAHYPVIYVLGLEKDALDEIKNYLKRNSALVVWVDFKADDLKREQSDIVQFFARELVPYIDTNYFTFDTAEKRILCAYGEAAAQAAVVLMEKPNLFNYAAFVRGGEGLAQLTHFPTDARVSVTGTQRELNSAQRALERAGAQFGTQFLLHYGNGDKPVLSEVDLAYFFAQKEELVPVKIEAELSAKQLPLQDGAWVYLHVGAELKNKMAGSYIPQEMRFSPPFLSWDGASGKLSVLSGAERGKVKISAQAGPLRFKTALKLKKP